MQTTSYEDRLNRVCDYIRNHLDEDLSVERYGIWVPRSREELHDFPLHIPLSESVS